MGLQYLKALGEVTTITFGILCREWAFFSILCFCYMKVIDNDHGAHMRPMPGMYGLSLTGSKVFLYF